MKAFNGVFIVPTNLLGDIDPAALRRFDLKPRFGFLLPDQAEAMMRSCCRQLLTWSGRYSSAAVGIQCGWSGSTLTAPSSIVCWPQRPIASQPKGPANEISIE